MYCVSNCVAHLIMQCVVVIGDVPGSSKLWVGGGLLLDVLLCIPKGMCA